jgi:hypothetical protein
VRKYEQSTLIQHDHSYCIHIVCVLVLSVQVLFASFTFCLHVQFGLMFDLSSPLANVVVMCVYMF